MLTFQEFVNLLLPHLHVGGIVLVEGNDADVRIAVNRSITHTFDFIQSQI